MTGQVTLGQGQFGVAQTTPRRPDPAPERTAARPAHGTSTQGDPSHGGRTMPPLPHPSKGKPDQGPMSRVSPATLFEASRLAPLSPARDTAARAAQMRRNAGWSPPHSSLSLRDRKI